MSTADSERWDKELSDRASPAPLLQTWAWGDVQSHAGWSIERLRLPGGAMASVQLRSVGPVKEAYVPRGPVPVTVESIGALADWARGIKVARLTVEPEADESLSDALKKGGFEQVAPTQPQYTRILDLGPEAQMLAGFKHGRRYNIRAGERRGVRVEEGKDAPELAHQSAAVEKRESIHLPPASYYRRLLETLPWSRTFVARHPDTGDALAAVLVARHDGRAYHLFAGRTGEHPELMANDLAWWAGIKAAAEAGDTDYDLWGVPPPGAGRDHPWAGLGFFKAEFGGKEVAYAGAWRLVVSGAGARVLDLERQTRGRIRGLKRNIS